MDIDDAVYAAKLVGAKTVIPFHYNTWPIIEADLPTLRKNQQNTWHCIILQPGTAVNTLEKLPA